MKLKIGVFMGGKSIEREVSFNSGRTICDHLDTSLYDIVPLFQTVTGLIYHLPWRFVHRGKISDFEHRLPEEALQLSWDDIKEQIDFMYIAQHGRHGEDGELQGMLELLRIPYLGSKVYASALGMNKTVQKQILRANGIAVPHGITVPRPLIQALPSSIEQITACIDQSNLSYPLIVKPEQEGSSLGTALVKSKQDLLHGLITAGFANHDIPQPVIIEEQIKGLEFTCIIVTDADTKQPYPLSVTEVIHEDDKDFYDYDQKYMPGRAHKITPARIKDVQTQRIQEACVQVMHILDIRTIARIDGFLKDDGNIVIIDPNTLSGMAPSSFTFRQAAERDISHSQLINHLIKTELSLYGMDAPIINKQHSQKIPNTQKIRVGVLLGGNSNERETSFDSGRNVCYKLSPDKYEALPLFLSSNLELYQLNQRLLVQNTTKEVAQYLEPSMKIKWSELPQKVDFVFIALHGGEGENGVVQGALQTLNIPYNGSGIFASALCMDKYRTNQLLKLNGFDVPANVLVDKESFLNDQTAVLAKIEQLGYPVIIKPHDDGCSVMVQKAKNPQETVLALNDIFTHGKTVALVEEFIKGMELTVGVLGNESPQALPPSYAVSGGDVLTIEEKFLPGAGENQTPAPISPAATKFVQQIIENVFQTAQCTGYARIDCFYQSPDISPTGNHRLVIIEINTLPGLTPATCIFHQAAEIGIKPMDFIDKIIELGFEAHRLRTQPITRPSESDTYENV